jgi:hypothetical protein
MAVVEPVDLELAQDLVSQPERTTQLPSAAAEQVNLQMRQPQIKVLLAITLCLALLRQPAVAAVVVPAPLIKMEQMADLAAAVVFLRPPALRVLVTHQAQVPRKAQMAAQAQTMARHLAAGAAAERRQPEQTQRLLLPETAVLVLRLALAVPAWFMLVAVVDQLFLMPTPKEPAVLAAVAMVGHIAPAQSEAVARQTPGAALAVVEQQPPIMVAPASSSSSTTSALPQSSPSSHRRSGLHQRVR